MNCWLTLDNQKYHVLMRLTLTKIKENCSNLPARAVGGTADAEIMDPLGYQRLPLSKPGVGQSVALHASPADKTSTYYT